MKHLINLIAVLFINAILYYQYDMYLFLENHYYGSDVYNDFLISMILLGIAQLYTFIKLIVGFFR